MADNNSVCSFEEDLLSCDIRDECGYAQKTINKDNNEDDVCKERCLDQEDDVNKAKCLGIIGWTVRKRHGGGFNLKKGIVDSYDESTRFFKVKYKDGSMDTIVERELLSCLDPHGRSFPHHLFLEPPVPEGEKPKHRPVLMMRATLGFQHRTPPRRTAKGNKKGKGAGGYVRTNAQAENAGGVGSPKERRLGKAAEASGTETQNAAGDSVPAENAGGVGSPKERLVGKAADASGTETQNAAGDGVPAENAGGVSSPKEGLVGMAEASGTGTRNAAGDSFPPREVGDNRFDVLA